MNFSFLCSVICNVTLPIPKIERYMLHSGNGGDIGYLISISVELEKDELGLVYWVGTRSS